MLNGNNGIPNSFLDLLGQNNQLDFKKLAKKSLAYDELKLKKIRAIYGRRATFIKWIESKDGEKENETKKDEQSSKDEPNKSSDHS